MHFASIYLEKRGDCIIKRGKFITFEGGDGCGKTTQLKRTVGWLQTQGKDVLHTFEPGDSPLGQKIRQLLLSGEFVPVAACELLLFLADRAQHVAEVIEPALAAGKWVVCDRYSDSTLAYQLAGRKLHHDETLQQMLTWAEQGCAPDMTFWLDLPVQEAGKRLLKRQQTGGKNNRLDDEKQAFHQAVYQAFQQLYAENPQRIQAIQAQQEVAQVHADICQHLRDL